MPDKIWGTHLAYNSERIPDGISQPVTRRPTYGRSPGGVWDFKGWRWICPGCRKPANLIFYPLPPMMLDFQSTLPNHRHFQDPDQRDRGLPCFACQKRHGIQNITRVSPATWNILVTLFSGGLLYGREVPKPAWYERLSPRKIRTRPARIAPRSPRRAEVLHLLLTTDLTTRRMATQVGIAESSLNAHIKRIYRDHGVKDRDELRAKLAAPAADTGAA